MSLEASIPAKEKGNRPTPVRAVTATEQKGGPAQQLGQALIATLATPQIKGITGNTHRRKMGQPSILKTDLTTKLLEAHSYTEMHPLQKSVRKAKVKDGVNTKFWKERRETGLLQHCWWECKVA